MAKGRKRRRGETFESEVRHRFGPVADRLGLIEEELLVNTTREEAIDVAERIRHAITQLRVPPPGRWAAPLMR